MTIKDRKRREVSNLNLKMDNKIKGGKREEENRPRLHLQVIQSQKQENSRENKLKS